MSLEHGHEFLILASKVNSICAVESPKQVTDQVLEDAQSVINALDSKLGPSGLTIERGSRKSGSGTQNNMVTNTGHVLSQPDGKSSLKRVEYGHQEVLRIGLYKTTKLQAGSNVSLNFQFFMESVDVENQSITKGPVTHLIYTNEEKLLNGLTISVPNVYSIGRFKFITYVQQSLWGVGKSNWASAGIMW